LIAVMSRLERAELHGSELRVALMAMVDEVSDRARFNEARELAKKLLREETSMRRDIILLKCWPVYFDAILRGDKNFDVRVGNDREYRVGDELRLQEWDLETKQYTGRNITRYVLYVMHGKPLLPDDVWVLALRHFL